VETVLGLSVTATNVQTVLVEGRGADGATLEYDEFDVFSGAVSAARASEQVAEAVLSIANADGHRLHAIGVTWSDGADLEASLVLESLSDLGFDNVVAVRLPRAAEALACSIGRIIGYRRTAVCVVEPDTVVLSLVDTLDGEVETLVSHVIGRDDLLEWIASIFDRDDWLPEGLFLVGSVGGLGSLVPWLEQGLGVPVFDPPEAELAAAHGAALASAFAPTGPNLTHDYAESSVPPRRPRAPMGRVVLLAGASATFVVATALAISPHLLPERNGVPTTRAEVRAELLTPPPVAPPPAPAIDAPPPDEPPAAELPLVPTAPDVEEVPAYQPPVEAVAPPVEESLAPRVDEPVRTFEHIVPAAPAPPVGATPLPPAPQEPARQPRLRDRILDRIPGLDRLGNG
jgi:hypothetical protein